MSSIDTCEKCGQDYNIKTVHFCANKSKKKPGHYMIDAESFDKLVEDLQSDAETSKAVKKARKKFLQLRKKEPVDGK